MPQIFQWNEAMFKKRPGKSYLPSLLKSSVYAALLSTSICSYAADGRSDYDLDDDGLIEINDISDLIAIPRFTRGTSLYGSSAGCPAAGCFGFELTKDLDFDTNQDGVINFRDTNDDLWVPISLRDATFEGNGYVILNLRVFANDSYSGLFGYVDGSIVRNIGLSGPLMFVRGGYRSGSLVASARNTHIENVFNTGSVRARVTDGPIEGALGYAGGLVGELSNGSSLINAFNSGPVYGAYPGGLVGHSEYSPDIAQSIIRNGLNIGKLTRDRSADGYAGGILASHGPSYAEDLKVENSYWATDASGEMDSYGSGRPGASTTKSYFGLSLEDLKCAEQANIPGVNRCFYLGSTPILFKDWDKAQFDGEPFWDFGSDIQIAAPNMHGNAYRDTDSDTVPDFKDDFPFNIAVSKDSDKDGYPDNWNSNCDVTCREESGLILDQFPNVDAAWQDEDLDSLPDSWAQGCDTSCKNNSGLTLDSSLNDTDNDGIKNHVDNDDSGNGSIDVDANSNGLVDIYNLEQLNAIRYQLDGNGLRMENRGSLDQSGCPLVTYESVLMRRCHGYELLTDLDFDTSQDGVLGIGDDFWNDGKGWIAIGGRFYPFTGTFEGNGYTIHNLLINQSTDYQALFATAENAVIRNLRLSGSLMSVQGANYVGSLVGSSKLSRIENVFNTGAVQGSQIIGGIVGYLRESHMENVLNTGSITGDNRVGGLVGHSSGAYQYENTPLRISIMNGLNTGFVTGYDGVNAGGLVGLVDSSSIIENSYWAEDASGLSISSRESEDRSYVGLSLAVLQCAIQANTHSGNSNCVSSDGSAEGLTSGVTLFKNWNQAMLNGLKLWDFGNSSQLPAMVFRGEVYRDSDGDFIVDGQDAYPYIPLEGRPDTDNDGIPNECDQACLVTGMSEDIDDDNDGVLDAQDAYPLVAIGDLTDTDNDGAPDSCDATCIELGMAADRDDDNDGVLDAQDAYPLIAIGDLTDTDSDGAPDSCDADCLALGMTADLDNDNDGVADVNDVYPLIALGERLDTDNDGVPNECDSACEALGMLADTDDDNDGIADDNDVYPLIAIGDLTDTDSDGAPDSCDATCIELGMTADRDDDNDGVLDAQDAYPLIAIGDLTDTDSDGAPDSCDAICIELGMAADWDDDNDGVADVNDAYPLIALGERLDTDNDGVPNECDSACEALGMLADIDDDNDGVADANDAYPLIALGERLDTDSDGIPNECDTACEELGMLADTDNDNDGVEDANDAYPLISLGERLDTDNDGIPNQCNQTCVALGMTADTDDDNDGVLDANDAYPLIALGERLDTDNDGAPDTCDEACTTLGMAADTDDDNDGVADANDAYPLISLGGRLDSDNDGIPNQCDTACEELGMLADTDNDNDGVADANDAYPLISLGGRLDSDHDGIPNECDTACEELGMLADTDNDNDGVADANDAYPLISLGGRLDSDNDGIPNECDTVCEELGMLADTDDDNDGVADANDAYPLIALGERLDSDGDGIPNQCDQACTTLGMVADSDDDNDGVLDVNDVFPLIAIGDLTDTDNDGAPNTCDVDCLALGMSADLDDDNDGVLDTFDAFQLISLAGRLDSDSDGIPNDCDIACQELGMIADSDDDNDGVLDANDVFPLIAIGDLTDTDNDGAPDACDESCLATGMAADLDDDNDGVADVSDAYPLIALGERLDTDSDGIPNECDSTCEALGMLADTDDDNDGVLDVNDVFPLDRTEHSDFDNDGLGDVADTDDDNDGVDDINDPNLGADNGAPEIVFVPTIPPVAVTTENGDAFELLVDETFLNHFQTVDAVDTVFTYEGSLDGEVLAIDENNIMLIPAGHQAIQLVAIDTSGNRSEPYELVVNVYPRVRFEQSTSITGEHSTTNIKVQLTGDSPEYPVVVNFNVSQLSDVDQNDLDDSFDIEAQHQVIIEAGEAEALNRDGFIEILIIEDNESENDELLVVDLLSAQLASESEGEIESLFAIDETNQQHELTVTYQNLAPTVQLKLKQDGVEVANVTQGGGQVSIMALIQDGNGMDTHTITWDLNDIGLNAPLGEMLSFNPDNIPAGSYSISVEVVDSGIGNLTDTATIEFNIVEPVVQPDNREGESSGGGGSLPLWFIVLMFMSLLTRQQANRQKTYVK